METIQITHGLSPFVATLVDDVSETIAPVAAYQSFTRVARQYNAVAQQFEHFPIAAKLGPKYFLSHRPINANIRSLDVGCGTGRTVEILSPYFEESHGIDISKGMLEVAKDRCEPCPNTHLAQMNAAKLDFPDCHFDYVASHTTLHHFEDAHGPLQEMKRVLKPGGKLLVIDIIGHGLMKRHAGLVRRLVAGVHATKYGFRHGPKQAINQYKALTPPDWMQHLREDHFLPEQEMKTIFEDVFPRVMFRKRHLELGLNTLMCISWVKPL